MRKQLLSVIILLTMVLCCGMFSNAEEMSVDLGSEEYITYWEYKAEIIKWLNERGVGDKIEITDPENATTLMVPKSNIEKQIRNFEENVANVYSLREESCVTSSLPNDDSCSTNNDSTVGDTSYTKSASYQETIWGDGTVGGYATFTLSFNYSGYYVAKKITGISNISIVQRGLSVNFEGYVKGTPRYYITSDGSRATVTYPITTTFAHSGTGGETYRYTADHEISTVVYPA